MCTAWGSRAPWPRVTIPTSNKVECILQTHGLEVLKSNACPSTPPSPPPLNSAPPPPPLAQSQGEGGASLAPEVHGAEEFPLGSLQ